MNKPAKITLGIVGGFIAIGVVAGVTGNGNADSKTPAAAPTATSSATPVADPKPAQQSQAQQFKAFVAKNGLPNEKTAVKHVTKVTGADKSNGILDAPVVWTDFSGDMFSADGRQGKLIASAFADWKHSKNGLVTVNNATGDILANGNF